MQHPARGVVSLGNHDNSACVQQRARLHAHRCGANTDGTCVLALIFLMFSFVHYCIVLHLT